MNRAAEGADSATASRHDPNGLISLVASTATAALVLALGHSWQQIEERPSAFLGFVGLAIALQLVTVEVYNRGAMSFASTGLLAVGFAFGAGAAMATAVLLGVVNLVVRRGRLNRGVFDAAQLSLAAGAGTVLYHALTGPEWPPLAWIAPSVLASAAYFVVNVGLLLLAMSLADGTSPREIWSERFRWTTPYYFVSGPLAVAVTYAYDELGVTGLLAFALPPAMMMLSVRQYVSRTRVSVDEVRQANHELRHANEELEARNRDLQDLFQFAGGLASRAHDSQSLAAYAAEAISNMTGARVAISLGAHGRGDGVPLLAGDRPVGRVTVDDGGGEFERWQRLRDALLPYLATALESAELVEEVHRKHLATIAALSRSMEAKDYYTGGHTERVSAVAVALAARLGYSGSDLDAIEIGALLHDIGKIGIPERILHKPGPLDEDEWKVMKEHPIISEYILSDVDLPEIVLQIARSSHERMDGTGYPDGLKGEEIPLPARIVLVADAWDALTSDRPYRRGRSVLEALQEMRVHAGTQFCPRVIEALERIYREEPHMLGAAYLRAVEAGAA